MIKLIFLFMLQIPWGWAETQIPVQETVYEIPDDKPSCRILINRKLEREEMIRELLHLKKIKANDPRRNFMLRNDLHSNKEFLDKALWADEAVTVEHILHPSKELSDEINKVGLENTHLYIKATGAEWKGLVKYYPDDFEWSWSPTEQILEISYKIYLSNFCYEMDPEVTLKLFPRKAPLLDLEKDDSDFKDLIP